MDFSLYRNTSLKTGIESGYSHPYSEDDMFEKRIGIRILYIQLLSIN